MCDNTSPTQTSPEQSEPELHISDPTPQTKILAGDSITLRWTESLDRYSIAYFDSIALLSGEGDGWRTFDAVPASRTEARVEIPELPFDSLAIRLYDSTANEEVVATYALRYYIFTATPDTGVTYRVGDTLHFAWRIAPSLSRAVLKLAFDGGRQEGYITGEGAIDYPDTTYDWIIGQDDQEIAYPTNDAWARVADYENYDMADVMSGTFDIVDRQ
jgi:hypothetical protein